MNVLFNTLLFAVMLAIVYIARAVVVTFAFSILFAYLINPIVRFLQGHSLFFKNLRGPHVAEAYLALLIVVGLMVHGLAPQFLPRAGQLLKESPAVMEDLYSGDIAVTMGHRNGWDEAQSMRVKSLLQQRREDIRSVVESIRQFASVAFGGLVMIPILAMFFLSGGEELTNGVIRLVSTRETQRAARALAADLNDMLRHYIRAKVILGLLSLLFCSVALLFSGYRHSLALGLMCGVLEFIPVVGWITAAITIVTVGLVTHAHWIWMAALLGLWRMVMDYAIAPRVMGHELEIHPLLAIFAVMIGGALGGIVGIYLSVPLVAALRVVWNRFYPPDLDDVIEARREATTPIVAVGH